VKLWFPFSNDGNRHEYCISCGEESIDRLEGDRTLSFLCRECGMHSDRSILITPEMNWWIDSDDEYWHESSGVLVRDYQGRFLFFRRTMYPCGLTVPAGHVGTKERAHRAAIRELEEEVGIRVRSLKPVAAMNIVGDSCSAGSDSHRWHVFLCAYEGPEEVEVSEEGKDATWLALDDALTEDLTFATRKILEYCLARLRHEEGLFV
jgi:8-oxo-dGTP pyrophosphatase MutT (NUDIX family)